MCTISVQGVYVKEVSVQGSLCLCPWQRPLPEQRPPQKEHGTRDREEVREEVVSYRRPP